MIDAERRTLLVHLDGKTLPAEVYEQYDLTDLEDQLEEAIIQTGVGEYDGNEIGLGVVTLFMYGPDGEAIFRVVEPILLDYPLCQNARVIIESSSPATHPREVRLPRL